ncbi:hypothetical protein J0A67_09995 [Algoriphagus aestuariicola]|uniref:Uncharacterized protein n=1 Tax=Algoriphagus aestuariicola TaxID=1852016 RepID=A0ABS3BU29_9BACT|nr:hypothetical protein [Algoriphagus aestuariicola]MBN7801194.1 hypothetical protein [Algoriphagus aestuariicola]
MEMNFPGGLWLPLVAMFVVSLPFLFHLINSRRQEKSGLESFQEFASTRKLVLDKVQRWRNHYMLGLDLKQNILVYCRFGYYPAQMTIPLDEVDHTSLDAHYEEVPVGKTKLKKLDYLDILLHFKDRSKPAKSITIFDQRQIRTMTDEHFIAENWVLTLNRHLKSSEDNSGLRLAM